MRSAGIKGFPALLAALVLLLFVVGEAGASDGLPTRLVPFDGESVVIQRGWSVYRLAQHPAMCVRLDRKAVYLGTPSPQQDCPAEAIGRRRAILVEPRSRAPRLSMLPRAQTSATTGARSGTVFTGLGFDACSTPSTRAMSAWKGSPYRAIGVYVGGENRACSQPSLTPEWVAAQTAAGWHLIPTYVGLQAPTSACSSCAKLSSSQATAQGVAAAVDAVEAAGAVAMGPGSPIYFDMESYSRTASATSATLTFLEAWTKKLHALGYGSGVYSSSASGIADLAGQVGSGYELPDHLWIANWNGAQSTSDSVVPSSAWTPHQRIHQYRGGHDESYGGVAINIDNDYVDGATVGEATLPPTPEDDPLGALDLSSAPAPGQVRIRGWAFDPNLPTQPLALRLVVGGREGEAGVASYDLGAVANLPRRDVRLAYPEAGGRHGFDLQMATVKSGRQRLCAYALDLDPGEDKLLGCKGVTIPVAIRLSHLKARPNGIQVRVTCLWPAGTDCPGQIVLRARFRVPLPHHRGRGPRARAVSRVIGRAAFRLTGGEGHGYRVPLSAGGRKLLRLRSRLQTQVMVAIPGGHRTGVIELRR
jgi:hypothetical protein